MCCGRFASGPTVLLQNQGYPQIIPQADFVAGDTYADFYFYRCINESKFRNALNAIRLRNGLLLGNQINTDSDVRKLAADADSGNDIRAWGVSLKNLLGSIKYTKAERENARCKIAFSNGR